MHGCIVGHCDLGLASIIIWSRSDRRKYRAITSVRAWSRSLYIAGFSHLLNWHLATVIECNSASGRYTAGRMGAVAASAAGCAL